MRQRGRGGRERGTTFFFPSRLLPFLFILIFVLSFFSPRCKNKTGVFHIFLSYKKLYKAREGVFSFCCCVFHVRRRLEEEEKRYNFLGTSGKPRPPRLSLLRSCRPRRPSCRSLLPLLLLRPRGLEVIEPGEAAAASLLLQPPVLLLEPTAVAGVCRGASGGGGGGGLLLRRRPPRFLPS